MVEMGVGSVIGRGGLSFRESGEDAEALWLRKALVMVVVVVMAMVARG